MREIVERLFENRRLREVADSIDIKVLYHSSDESLSLGSLDFSKSKEVGLHLGTLESAKKIGHSRIYEIKVSIDNPLHIAEDIMDWSSAVLCRYLPGDYLEIHNKWQSYCADIQGDAKLYKSSEFYREWLSNHGYDSISYVNQIEDKGSISYILINKENFISIEEVK